MLAFQPDMTTTLVVDSHTYKFLPHPLLSDEVYKVPREQTTTYQLMHLGDESLWALKVLNSGYSGRHNAQLLEAVAPYKHEPGLLVANRLCLTRARHMEVIAHHPILEHAILMPWVKGKTWAGYMADTQIGTHFQRTQALKLARATSTVLWNLEERQLAHTDLSGDNVVVQSNEHVELIDIEGLYIPGKTVPVSFSRGWSGYQHPHLDQRGNYRPEGDRFAAAMLLTEMLTWWNPTVRAVTPDMYDSLFQMYEQEPHRTLQRRLMAVRNTLRSLNSHLCDLFDQAWLSSDLADCPALKEWALCLYQQA